jgi:hypothetical protein
VNAASDYRLTAPVNPAGFRDRDVYKIIVPDRITPGYGLVKKYALDARACATSASGAKHDFCGGGRGVNRPTNQT